MPPKKGDRKEENTSVSVVSQWEERPASEEKEASSTRHSERSSSMLENVAEETTTGTSNNDDLHQHNVNNNENVVESFGLGKAMMNELLGVGSVSDADHLLAMLMQGTALSQDGGGGGGVGGFHMDPFQHLMGSHQSLFPFAAEAFRGRAAIDQSDLRVLPSATPQDLANMNLIEAVFEENIPQLQELLHSGDVDPTCSFQGQTPLHIAAQAGSNEVVRVLLNAGVDVSIRNGTNCTPLHIAAQNAHKEVAQTLLVEAGANVFCTDEDQWTPLHFAACNNHVEMVSFLIHAGENSVDNIVHCADLHRITPLHIAALRGFNDVVTLLIEARAVVNAKEDQGRTPLHYAVQNGHLQVVDTLLSAGADVTCVENRLFTPLHIAALDGNVAVVSKLIEAGANPNALEERQWSPLHCAAQNGHHEVVETLLEFGADLTIVTLPSLNTPLHLAAFDGHSAVLKVLLTAGADVDTCNERQLTPLHLAAQNGDGTSVQVLLQHHANVSSCDVYKLTPLHFAAENGHFEAVELLLQSGADVASGNEEQATPLHLAVQNNHRIICEALLEANADLFAETMYTMKPIDYATIQGKVGMVRFLACWVSVHELPFNVPQRTPTIDWALIRNELDCLQVLVDAWPKAVFEANEDGWIPLQMAVYCNSKKGVEVLVRAMTGQEEGPSPSASVSTWSSRFIALAMGRSKDMLAELEKLEVEGSRAAVLNQWFESIRCDEGVEADLQQVPLDDSGSRLGKGGFGDVSRVTLTTVGDTVAIKRGDVSVAFETAVMKGLNHPNIVRVAGHWLCPATPSSEKRSSCMVMELMNCGSLKDWAKELDSRGQGYLLDERLLRSLMKQSLSALQYLHLPIHTDPFGRENMSIVHHDIKPHNMLIHERDDGELILKLADFGLSNFNRYHSVAQHMSLGGTRAYLGPEAQRNSDGKLQYTPASDIYSWAQSFAEIGANCGLNVSPPALDLLVMCSNPDPTQRPSAKGLLEYEYFANDEAFEELMAVLVHGGGGNDNDAQEEHHVQQQHAAILYDDDAMEKTRSNATTRFDEQENKGSSFSSRWEGTAATAAATAATSTTGGTAGSRATTTTTMERRFTSFGSNLSALLCSSEEEA